MGRVKVNTSTPRNVGSQWQKLIRGKRRAPHGPFLSRQKTVRDWRDEVFLHRKGHFRKWHLSPAETMLDLPIIVENSYASEVKALNG